MTLIWQDRLREKVAAREAAQADAEAAQEALYAAMLEVFVAGEASYRQIAEAVGLSRIRVGQVLRLQREKAKAAA
jgi:hypothetical protein